MSKSVLVVNTPKRCIECEFSEYISGGWFCLAKYRFEHGGVKYQIKNLKEISSFCPLKTLPSQMEYNDDLWTNNAEEEYYKEGWNACLEEILGEGK